jgi:hypothetical protein
MKRDVPRSFSSGYGARNRVIAHLTERRVVSPEGLRAFMLGTRPKLRERNGQEAGPIRLQTPF